MSTRIYVMTHKAFEAPTDPTYMPLHVGHATAADDFGYMGDDSGDNISDRNCYYSELTGLYFVWKNMHDDIVGTCHYRRYLLNESGLPFTAEEIEGILIDNDIITTKPLALNYSYYEGFGENHKIIYLDETAKVIRDIYPEYYDTYDRLVHDCHTYFGNMMIMKKPLYDEYMKWLFDILFELENRVDVEEEDSYHRRIFGFISEFLQYVWVTYRGLKAYSCMVGITGEKAEIKEVKNNLREIFKTGDYRAAKEYFLQAREKRPDLMMEASDVTGDLHLCMEAIAIAGLEERQYGDNIINKLHDYDQLIRFCNMLNHYAIRRFRVGTDPEADAWMEANQVTEVARMVSNQMFVNNANPYRYIPENK